MTDDTFQDFDDDAQAPAHLKGMITAEIDVIRDIMQVVQMFLGETMVTGVILLQELESKEKEDEK
jgi:hypothetical protein